MSPQIYTPHIPTPEQRMIKRYTELKNAPVTAENSTEMDVIAHLLGVDDT